MNWRNTTAGAVLLAAVLTVSGNAAEPDVPRRTVLESMVAHVAPGQQAIWDVTNSALDDMGGIDPALMDDAGWDALAEAAIKLQEEGRILAQQPSLRVVAPGEKLAQDGDEGAYTTADIQSFIDADPDAFRAMAAEMSQSAAALATAARSRQAEEASMHVSELGASCETCHAQFWYPVP